tara:strand:- start:22 stop:420 length:399 start_codon:yes stop_codon:yes gene_type:complete
MGVLGLPDSKKGENMGVIQEIEKQYPDCTNEMLDNFDRAYQLFCRKQHDYGDSNIRLGLDLHSSSSESFANNRLAQLGVVIRMNDKINRLINLYKKDMVETSAVDESVEDTLIDLMNYANILMTLKAGKWGK